MDLPERLERGTRLINRRKFKEAQVWCTQTHCDFPDSLEAVKQLHLVLLLLNELDTAAALLRSLGCDIPELDWGDMMRDKAFFYIRHGLNERAAELLPRIEKAHQGDDNRLGCLLLAKALILVLRRDLKGALSYHKSAHNSITDPQWRYNNICHWQRTAYRAGKYGRVVWLGLQVMWGAPKHGTWKHYLGALAPWLKVR